MTTAAATATGAGAISWQAEYEAFGKAYTALGAPGNTRENNLRFPGQYFDGETNTHQNYFRDYDPAIGRYVQSDPIGLRGGGSTLIGMRLTARSTILTLPALSRNVRF
jgi:RHS repeat-associated protein